MLTSLSVDEILQPRYTNWSTNFRSLSQSRNSSFLFKIYVLCFFVFCFVFCCCFGGFFVFVCFVFCVCLFLFFVLFFVLCFWGVFCLFFVGFFLGGVFTQRPVPSIVYSRLFCMDSASANVFARSTWSSA